MTTRDLLLKISYNNRLSLVAWQPRIPY